MTKEVISRWQFRLLKQSMAKTGQLPKGSLEKFLRETMDIWVEPKPKIQAKHIPDAVMLSIIKQMEGMHTMIAYPDNIKIFEPEPYTTVYLRDICNFYPSIPPKVIQAKLRGMVKRGLIDGCACGCRGDFKVIVKESE
jgi:hypothetical protein